MGQSAELNKDAIKAALAEIKKKERKLKGRCENKDCIGGRAFEIRKKLFCSPCCGNHHFGLTEGDEDYWKSITT